MKNQVVFELFWKFFSASCCYTPLREGHGVFGDFDEGSLSAGREVF